MGKVIAEITMSLDGFTAGPDISNKQPLGINGERLHDWMFGKATDTDKAILAETVNGIGAVIVGNHTYSTAIDDAWGGATPFTTPAFVVCHGPPLNKIEGFTYVGTGIQQALTLARETAAEKNVWVMGGATIIQQYIKAGLVDELRIHIAPILLNRGTRLFENTGTEPIELMREVVQQTPGALHTVFSIKR